MWGPRTPVRAQAIPPHRRAEHETQKQTKCQFKPGETLPPVSFWKPSCWLHWGVPPPPSPGQSCVFIGSKRNFICSDSSRSAPSRGGRWFQVLAFKSFSPAPPSSNCERDGRGWPGSPPLTGIIIAPRNTKPHSHTKTHTCCQHGAPTPH